jgi:phage shock protein A
MTSETHARPADSLELASLAERLRDGPFRTLLALHLEVGMLAGNAAADDCERVQKLTELIELARAALGQFHDLTLELRGMIDRLSAGGPRVP